MHDYNQQAKDQAALTRSINQAVKEGKTVTVQGVEVNKARTRYGHTSVRTLGHSWFNPLGDFDLVIK